MGSLKSDIINCHKELSKHFLPGAAAFCGDSNDLDKFIGDDVINGDNAEVMAKIIAGESMLEAACNRKIQPKNNKIVKYLKSAMDNMANSANILDNNPNSLDKLISEQLINGDSSNKWLERAGKESPHDISDNNIIIKNNPAQEIYNKYLRKYKRLPDLESKIEKFLIENNHINPNRSPRAIHSSLSTLATFGPI